MLTESQKRAMRGETFGCECSYDGPQWANDPRCAHCGGTLDSPAIKAAKAKANDTDYVRKYGADKTYWTHFLSWQDATAADYTVAIDLITSESPEATTFIAHLLAMREVVS